MPTSLSTAPATARPTAGAPQTVTLIPGKALLDLIAALLRAEVRTDGIDLLPKTCALYVVGVDSWLDAFGAAHLLGKHVGKTVAVAMPPAALRGGSGAFLQVQCTVGPPPGAWLATSRESADAPAAGPLLVPVLGGDSAAVHAAAQWAVDAAARDQDAPPLWVAPLNLTTQPGRDAGALLDSCARHYAEGTLTPRAAANDAVTARSRWASDTALDLCAGHALRVDDWLREAAGDSGADHSTARAVAGLAQTLERAIANCVTLHFEHVLAALLRHMPARRFTEWQFRCQAFLLARALDQAGRARRHPRLAGHYAELIYEDDGPDVAEVLARGAEDGLLRREGTSYVRAPEPPAAAAPDHTGRNRRPTYRLAAAAEQAPGLAAAARGLARQPHRVSNWRVRRIFQEADMRRFEDDYARYWHEDLSKGPEVGRPFLLQPWRPRAGVVLAHGYMSAPLEVRALAQHLYARGYAVYGVRMKGHGTSPEDLARAPWDSWYAALNAGFAVMRTITPHIFLAGFSTGGCVALLGAARKGRRIDGVIPMCAPIRLRAAGIRFVPSVLAVNALLRRLGSGGWDYLANNPENKHINYTRNPLTGLRELTSLMQETERVLPSIEVPALVIQASQDNTVDPASAQVIYEKLAAPYKELAVFQSERHGIVNGPGSEAVFRRVAGFLNLVREGQARSFQRMAAAPPHSTPEADLADAATAASIAADEAERARRESVA